MKSFKVTLSFLTILLLAVFPLPVSADDLRHDAFGNFDGNPVGATLGKWIFMYSAEGDYTAANFSKFTDYQTAYSNTLGTWVLNDNNPSLSANLTDAPAQLWSTWTVPARGVFFHPSPTRRSVIRWKSGKDQTVDVIYSIRNIDGDCGNGIEYWVRRGDVVEATETLDNGVAIKTPIMDNQVFGKGDTLDFLVGPRDSDHGCDSTLLDVVIWPPGANTFEEFTDGIADGADPDWSPQSGVWKVNGKGELFSSKKSMGVNINEAAPIFPFTGGRIEGQMKMSRKAAGKPNGGFIFSYLDMDNYRYLKAVKAGKKIKVILGQVGDFGGETAGAKETGKKKAKAFKWNTFRIEINPGTGQADVYIRNMTKPKLSYTFGSHVDGGTGTMANKSKTFFDNISTVPP